MVEINARCFPLFKTHTEQFWKNYTMKCHTQIKNFHIFLYLSYHEEKKLKPTAFYDSESALSRQPLKPREKTLQEWHNWEQL